MTDSPDLPDASLWPDPDAIPDDPADPWWMGEGRDLCLPEWPEWVTGFRGHQLDAVREIVDGYRRGARVMVVDAPTGAGKTLIGEMVRRCAGLPTTYLSSTIGLQHQFTADFPYARRVMGAANYATEHGPPWVTCGDCEGQACGFCVSKSTCPYRVAKGRALGSDLTIANTAYWLHEAGHVRDGLRGRPLLVVDECDVMESALMGFVEMQVAEKWVRKVGMDGLKKAARRDTVTRWMVDMRGALLRFVMERRGSLDVKVRRDVKDAARLASKIEWWVKEWENDGREEGEGANWVRDYPRDNWGGVLFKAVRIDGLGYDAAWKWVGEDGLRGDDGWVLAMSATVVNGQEWIDSNGLGEFEWGMVSVPSPFPVENRPVVFVPIADMKMATWERDLDALITAIERVLERHPGEKVLVHTTSWKLNAEVMKRVRWRELGREVGTHTREDGAKGRERALDRHKAAKGGHVLVSPSMDRGVDLPGDECRVQIVCKIPFPYLGDRQIAERIRQPGGQTWYVTQTARTLVQMTGRGVRSAEDHATTYVLDKQVARWWGDAKRLTPKWWKDAVTVGKIREFS